MLDSIRYCGEQVVLPAQRGGVMHYRTFVNEEGTVFVRLWENGVCEMATRETPHDTWGPPVRLTEEK